VIRLPPRWLTVPRRVSVVARRIHCKSGKFAGSVWKPTGRQGSRLDEHVDDSREDLRSRMRVACRLCRKAICPGTIIIRTWLYR